MAAQCLCLSFKQAVCHSSSVISVTALLRKIVCKGGLTKCCFVCVICKGGLTKCCFVCVCSVEKDGSALSDERKTVQTSLLDLLKDFLLKSPTTRELHSILAYTAVVQDQQQVTHWLCLLISFLCLLHSFLCLFLSFLCLCLSSSASLLYCKVSQVTVFTPHESPEMWTTSTFLFSAFFFFSLLLYHYIWFCSIRFRSILLYSILRCSILFISTHFYVILFCSVQFYLLCSILFHFILFYSFLFCSILLHSTLICSISVLFYSVLFSFHVGLFWSVCYFVSYSFLFNQNIYLKCREMVYFVWY